MLAAPPAGRTLQDALRRTGAAANDQPSRLSYVNANMELLKEQFRIRRYKASQGRLIRKLTMWGVWIMFATAAWKCTLMDFTWLARWGTWFSGLSAQLQTARDAADAVLVAELTDKMATFDSAFIPVFTYSIAGAILLLGLWFGWRLINWGTFADFLISVEAEMAKVSWPGRAELKSSTIVVLVVFLFLAGLFLIYDFALISIFKVVGIQ